MILAICYAGGKMAENNGRSFGLGVLIALFLNIPGLLIIAFIGGPSRNKSFDPDFHQYKNDNIVTIKQLAKMHRQGRLSDEEFEHMKSEIMNTETG